MNESAIGQVLAFLPDGEAQQLAATLCHVEVPANTILLREGDYGNHLYIVLKGQLEVVKALGTSDERSLGTRGPGEFVGEMSLLLHNGLRTASVRTSTPAHVLEMTRADFDALLQRPVALDSAAAGGPRRRVGRGRVTRKQRRRA